MKNILTILIALCCVSCSNKKVTKDLKKIYGKEIKIPENGYGRIADKDTVFNYCNDNLKIVAYYNAKGCTSCRMKELGEWSSVMKEIHKAGGGNIDLILIFSIGKEINTLDFYLRQSKLTAPVLCDKEGEFERLNLLPADERLHYFLLDKNNKVVLVGSPISNPKMWDLYINKITELTNN